MKNYNEKITEYLRVKKLYFSIQADKPFKRKQFFLFQHYICAYKKGNAWQVNGKRKTEKRREKNGKSRTSKRRK